MFPFSWREAEVSVPSLMMAHNPKLVGKEFMKSNYTQSIIIHAFRNDELGSIATRKSRRNRSDYRSHSNLFDVSK